MSETTHPTPSTNTFSVPAMSCQRCVEFITAEVTKVSGATVDLDAKTVTVTGGDPAAIISAIDEAGFDTKAS